jgi:gliding motility-associated-like protein
MRSLLSYISFSILFLASSSSKGQVEYVPLTPEQWVTQYLVGPGAQVSNIEFFGDFDQLGLFLNLDTVGYGMPLETACGISNSWITYLVPGNSDSDVPEYYDAYSAPAFSGPYYAEDGDVFADLLNLSQEAMEILGWNYLDTVLFDPGIIEFDVMATSDTLSFEYLLTGGEVYRSAVCVHGEGSLSYAGDCYYHDVFSIFVAGPGITGPFSSPAQFPGGSVNMAYVPDTDPLLPMTSESLSDSVNNEFWIPYWSLVQEANNCGDIFDCYELAMIDEHGFSTLLASKIAVTCGQVYHIRIAIADVFDHIYNYVALFNPIGGTANEGINPSIFLSFNSGEEAIYDVYEDCNPVWVNIQRSEQVPISEPDTVYLFSSGVALEGLDFDVLPEYVIIPAGESTYSFSLGIIDDSMMEGMEYMILSCLEIHNDNQSCEISVSVQVWDSAVPITVENTEVLVCGEEVVLSPDLSGGYGQYTLLWPDQSTGDTFLLYEPDQSTEAFVIIDDVCSFQPDTVYFDLIFFDLLQVDIELDSILYTCNTVLSVEAVVSGGYGEYEYSWDPYASMDDTTVYEYNTALGPQMVYLTVEDDCNIGVTDSTMIYTLLDPVMVYNGEDSVYVNCNGQAVITPGITGGFGPYTNFYFIGQNLQVGNSATITPTDTLLIVVMSYDMCGQTLVTPVTILPVMEPIQIHLPDTTNLSCSGLTTIQPEVDGGFGSLIYQWYENGVLSDDVDGIYEYSGTEESELIVQVTDECGQLNSASSVLLLEIEPIELSMVDSVVSDCLSEVEFTYQLSGGQEPFEYSWVQNGLEIGVDSALTGLTFNSNQIIELQILDNCGQVQEDSVMVFIENTPIDLDISQVIVNCGEESEIDGSWFGGEGTISFEWFVDGAIAGTGESFMYVFDSELSEVIWTAEDQCNQTDSDTLEIISQLLPLNVALDSTLVFSCGDSVTIVPQILEGADELEYQWYFNGLIQSNEPQLQDWNPSESGILLLIANDACGVVDSSLVAVQWMSIALSSDLPEIVEIDCATSLNLLPDQSTWTDETSSIWFFESNQISFESQLSIDNWTQNGWIQLVLSDPCSSTLVDSVLVSVLLNPLSGSIGDYYICEPSLLEITGEVVGGNGSLQYFWNDEASDINNLSIFIESDTSLHWLVLDQCDQMISDTSNVFLVDIASEILWSDMGGSGLFAVSDTACANCTYNWVFDDVLYSDFGFSFEYTYPPNSDFTVMLITTNEWCVDTSYLFVSPPSSYYIPNSFTPNNDGVNDVFGIESIGLTDVEFTIYDRWGEVVYSSNDANHRWTGNYRNGSYYCADGSYVYHLKAVDMQNQLIDRRGSVLLFR